MLSASLNKTFLSLSVGNEITDAAAEAFYDMLKVMFVVNKIASIKLLIAFIINGVFVIVL